MATDRLTEISEDFTRLQQQKCRNTGGFEARVLTNLAFLAGEQYVAHHMRRLIVTPLDANKLHLVFNLAGRLLHKVVGRLAAINGVYKAIPDHNTPKSRADSEVVDKLIRALDEKIGQPTRTWELLYWLAIGGVAFEYVPWIKDATQEPLPQFDTAGELLWKHEMDGSTVPDSMRKQMIASGMPAEHFTVVEEMALAGDVGSEILSPLQVFLDASVRAVEDLPPDAAVYIAKVRTVGWIEENFDNLSEDTMKRLRQQRDVKIVTTSFMQSDGASTGNTHLDDLIPRIQGTKGANDPDMAVVVERYQGASKRNPHGKYTIFVPHVAVLLDGDNPYEEIPLVDYHWDPTITSFWTKDFLTDLIAPQRFLNKRFSQLGEQANAIIYSNPLLGPGLTKEKIPADYPAPIEGGLNEAGMKMVQRLDPPQLPNWFLRSIELSIQLIRELAGGTDLTDEQRFPGQLRGPMAVPMLQEIMDTEWGLLYQHLGERTARVKQMRLNRVKKFYPPYRTLHYTGPDMRDEVFTFHTQEILGAGVEYRVTVERGSLVPELRALREERVAGRVRNFPFLYTDDRTGKFDKTLVATELQFGTAAREAASNAARKLAGELLERLQKGETLPDYLPLPFWDLRSMMDELEDHMTTTEFLASSPQTLQAILAFWNRCREKLAALQQAQQQAVQGQQMEGAVAQATQMAAAKAASETVEATLRQLSASREAAPEAQQFLARSLAEREEG